MLQHSVSLPQIIDLLLQSLQSSFSSTHCLLFLISDQPYQLRADRLSMERMSSVKMLSVSSTAVCAERCYTHSTGSSMSLRAALLSISCCSSAQTHLMRLHSRSQLFQLFLSLLDSLLIFHLCLLQKPLFTETHQQLNHMLSQHFRLHLEEINQYKVLSVYLCSQ